MGREAEHDQALDGEEEPNTAFLALWEILSAVQYGERIIDQAQFEQLLFAIQKLSGKIPQDKLRSLYDAHANIKRMREAES